MTPAIDSDLTKYRKPLLDALAKGPKGSQLPETAWPAIQCIMWRCQKRRHKAQKADEKAQSKKTIDDIVKVLSKTSRILNRMKERERNRICRELGRDPEIASASDARDNGLDILNEYLIFSEKIANSAKAAISPITRRTNSRNARVRLINELNDLWKKIHHESPLKPGVSKIGRQYFELFVITAVNLSYIDKITTSEIKEDLKWARTKEPSDDSEESEEMMR